MTSIPATASHHTLASAAPTPVRRPQLTDDKAQLQRMYHAASTNVWLYALLVSPFLAEWAFGGIEKALRDGGIDMPYRGGRPLALGVLFAALFLPAPVGLFVAFTLSTIWLGVCVPPLHESLRNARAELEFFVDTTARRGWSTGFKIFIGMIFGVPVALYLLGLVLRIAAQFGGAG